MAVDSIEAKAKVSNPALAPADKTPPADKPAPGADKPDSDRDTREPPRPKVDLCWPPPIAYGLPGIAQIRPMCYHLRRFGGPDAE
jgi:hypothetical protein